MITRVVMVEFRPDFGAEEIESFEAELRELAARASGLICMSCGAHCDTEDDVALSREAPNVVFGNFVSVWKFRDREALNQFLRDPVHRQLASRWRRAVKSRYVINMESAS